MDRDALRLSKKAADHLRQYRMEYNWQIETTQTAVSFYQAPQISGVFSLSRCKAQLREE